MGLLGDRLQDELPPTSIVMNMLLMLPGEDREVRPLIETVSHDPNDHLDALGVILEGGQLSDSRPAGAVEPVSVELRSMVDVVAPEAVADHGLREGAEVEAGTMAIPEVRINTSLRSTAKRTKVNLRIADLADSVMITLIFAGFVAFVADIALKLIFHFFQPPFGSLRILVECGGNTGISNSGWTTTEILII